MWEFVPLVAIVLLFWLLLIRPGQRRQRAVREVQATLAVGDRVMLTSGFFGTVRALHDDRLDVEIAEGVTVSVVRGAIATVDRPDDQTLDDPHPAAAQDDTHHDDGAGADDVKEG